MHGSVPIGIFFNGCEYSDSPNCNYCGEFDDLTHTVVTCSRLSGLFQLTQSLIRKLTPTINKIPVRWYIICIPTSSGLDVNVRRMGNGTFAQEKKCNCTYIVDSTKTCVVGLIVQLHCSKLK